MDRPTSCRVWTAVTDSIPPRPPSGSESLVFGFAAVPSAVLLLFYQASSFPVVLNEIKECILPLTKSPFLESSRHFTVCSTFAWLKQQIASPSSLPLLMAVY